jgi:protein DJ-1
LHVEEEMMTQPRVLVILAEGAEEMETTISVDILRRGGIDVVLAGLDGDSPVLCSRNVCIVPDIALDRVTPPVDALVLPGGAEGARRLCGSEAVGRLLREFEAEGRLVAAICAAPTAFVKHGVFAGRRMTCHPSVREVVAAHGKTAEGAVVDDGNLVTSQGPGTTFAFALTLVGRLAGEKKAREVRAPLRLDL